MAMLYLHRACEAATKACEEDKKKNYEAALSLYLETANLMCRSMKHEIAQWKHMETVSKYFTKYMNRAQLINKYLEKKEASGLRKVYTKALKDVREEMTEAECTCFGSVGFWLRGRKIAFVGGRVLYSSSAFDCSDEKRTHNPHLQEALEIITAAFYHDENENYYKAQALYLQAVDHFLLANKFEISDRSTKAQIRDQCSSFMDRAERIINHSLNTLPPKSN